MEFADVSHYQATVNLPVYAQSGRDRIFFKATEGTGSTDATFTARWRQAGQLGLARGAYHFGRSGDAAAEWRHFIAVVRAAGGLTARDLLVLDSEDPDKQSLARAHAAAFTRAAAADGFSGAIYTGKWYGDPARLTPDALAPGWQRLWLSDYSAGQADSAIELPTGWARSQVIARQYSSTATVPGITGACDANRVLNDWLSSTGEADMTPDETRMLTFVYNQVAGAVGQGQLDFKGTMAATLGTVQGVVNLVKSQGGVLGGAITDGKTATLTAIATIPAAHLDNEQVLLIAAQVVEKMGPQITGVPLTVREVEAALRHVFATAGTE
jgi:lysozyme